MIAGVTAYLFEKSEKAPWPAVATGDAARGKQLFENVGCQGCHISEPGAERHVMDGWRQHGPNLIGLSQKVTPEWLAAWLKNPKAYNPETRMPNLRLADDEIADLVAYLMSRPAQPEFQRSRAAEGRREGARRARLRLPHADEVRRGGEGRRREDDAQGEGPLRGREDHRQLRLLLRAT